MNPYLIDTHSHINFSAFKDDADQVIARALENNIYMIVVGVQYSTSKRAVKYAKSYEGIYAAVGLHPTHIKGVFKENVWSSSEREFEDFKKDKYSELLKEPKVVAVGEVGLDYYDKNLPEASKNLQKEVFKKQLDLALEFNKPAIIHCRKAYNDLIEILEVYSNSDLEAVVHSFEGNKKQAQKIIEMGFYLGFNGLITYASGLEKVVENISLDKILVETDCPFLAPTFYRGQRNEPSYVKYIAKKITEIKNLDFNKVASQTTNNAKKLFGI